MRVLHGPVNVGNQPWALSRAERKLGIISDVIVNYGTWFNFPADRTLSGYAEKDILKLARRALFALTSPFQYDVIHYYFGRNYSFWDDKGATYQFNKYLKIADLVIARFLGRRLFMTLQGCDMRIAGASSRRNAFTPCGQGRCPAFQTCLDSLDTARLKMQETVLPFMDRVFYLNPELGHYITRGEFLPYANVDIRSQQILLPDSKRSRPRIIHAPSNGDIKGTPRILEALERLWSRYDFELVLVQNMPHDEAVAAYRSADIAIDQLYAGWYGGFAVEIMAMGKPVAAYIRAEDKEFVPKSMWEALPILPIAADTLEADLIRIFDTRSDWPALGVASRQYVLDWHDPMMIAQSLKAIYENPAAQLVLGPSARD